MQESKALFHTQVIVNGNPNFEAKFLRANQISTHRLALNRISKRPLV